MDKWVTYAAPISSAQFAYPYGVPQWGRQVVGGDVKADNSMGAVRSPLVTSGSHGRAGPPPSKAATRGGW